MDRLDKLITERKQHMNIIKFEDLPISDDIKRAVIEMGFEEPSPIQSQSIPVILSGKDVIGQAQTGTGKTALFFALFFEYINREYFARRGEEKVLLRIRDSISEFHEVLPNRPISDHKSRDYGADVSMQCVSLLQSCR